MKKRTIRRIAVAGLLLALMLLICSAAAGENPVNPYQQEVWEFDRESNLLGRRGTRALVYGISFSVVEGHEPAVGQTGQWTVILNEELAGKTLRSRNVSLQTLDPDGNYSTVYLINNPTDTIETCEFVAPGPYRIVAFYYFTDGSSYAGIEEFTVAEDGIHPTLQGKAAQIVSECQVTGDTWQTAVNLHDWLIMHAHYDKNYEYYGADGVLMRGYGVCDSYSKAYVLLCQAAGIPVSRVTGVANGGNHAWNAIQLAGEWYLVDATWDDPTGGENEGQAISGNERHDYFCLNDELMSLDHTNQSSFSETCNSLDANWLVRSGDKNQMGDNITHTGSDSYSKRILQELNNGEKTFSVACEGQSYIYYDDDEGWISYSSHAAGSASATRGWTLLAAYLSQAPMTLDNGDEVNVSVTYDASGNCFVCEAEEEIRIEGTCGAALTWVLEDDGTLVISGTGEMYNFDSEDPPSWIDYREQIQAVRIEDGVTSIGEYAFSGYEQLQTVHIAGSVTIIGDCAFRRCSALSSVTLADGLETVGYMAFMGCNLSEIHISTGDTKTWDFFYGTAEGQDYLCHVDLPDSVTEVSSFAFCDNLFQRDLPDAVLPADLTTIEAEAFYGTNPRFVWLPDRVDEIGDYAFAACGSLEFVYVPFDCETIGTDAFPAGTKILGIRIYDLEPCAAQQYADQHEEIEFIEYENPYGGNG